MTYLEIAGSCSAVITGASVFISSHVTSYTQPFTAYESTIAIAWASKDLKSFSPTSAPLQEAKSAASASNPLSTGAKAGIGVGVTIAGLLLLSFVLWMFWRRKRSRKAAVRPRSDHKPELPGEGCEIKPTTSTGLNSDGERAELKGTDKPSELGLEIRHELEGGWRGHEAEAP